MPAGSTKSARRALYERELPRRLDTAFRAHPQWYDHRREHPWVTACLGDPTSDVWFVAENPSLGQVERARAATAETQWAVSPGDKLFRKMLVKHGFKRGTADSSGGWRCYITDVVKSVDRAEQWNRLPASVRREIAVAWAPVLAWEIELGQPKVVVSLGAKTDKLLDYLLAQKLIPPLPRRRKIHHYSYIASRADARRQLGPSNPIRLSEWDEEFAGIVQAAQLRVPASDEGGGPGAREAHAPSRGTGASAKPRQAEAAPPKITGSASIRDAIRSGLTPDQVYARHGRRRAVYIAAIEEEARQAGELNAVPATPATVVDLRDKRKLRWERIAARIYGDARRTGAAKDLYDRAKGSGASSRSYTGRGRRFPAMED